MRKTPHWEKSYNIAMRATTRSFLPANTAARNEIRERMQDVENSRDQDDTLEYSRLLQALADLNVLASSYWKRRRPLIG